MCRETWAEGAQYLTMEIQCYMLFVTLNCIMGSSMLYGYAVIVLCVLLRFMVTPPVPRVLCALSKSLCTDKRNSNMISLNLKLEIEM